jgi:hypothetical protein
VRIFCRQSSGQRFEPVADLFSVVGPCVEKPDRVFEGTDQEDGLTAYPHLVVPVG